MVFDSQKSEETVHQQVTRFVDKTLDPRQLIGKQRTKIIQEFCATHNINERLARGLDSLAGKFDRIKNRNDLEEVLRFALWLNDPHNAPKNFLRKGHMVYLADQKTPVRTIVESMKTNCKYWQNFFGDKIFGTSFEDTNERRTIWKKQLPIPGYYVSAVGSSGSGTFSVDLAIGYDLRETHQDTSGQIWRVGFDVEISPTGERIFRIIRTGSGQKSQGNEQRASELKDIRTDFLDAYKVSPQRLLLFLALQIAHDLRFDTVKGLSTEGAMDLSLLSRSVNPPDYTASMLDVGFTYREGNWHEIHDLQKRFYEDIFASYWHEDETSRYDVRGYTEVIKAFNAMTDEQGNRLPFKLADNPGDLEQAWRAYAKIHQSTLRRRKTDRAEKDKQPE